MNSLPSHPLTLTERIDSSVTTFDCDVGGSFSKLVKPLSSSNPGFDFLIASQDVDEGKVSKHVVLFECKSHETATGGKGSTFTKNILAKKIRNCVDGYANWFFDNDWTVSLVVICGFANTAENCVSDCVAKKEGGRMEKLWKNTAVITRLGLRDLFGPTLALRLELCVGLFPGIDELKGDVVVVGGSDMSNGSPTMETGMQRSLDDVDSKLNKRKFLFPRQPRKKSMDTDKTTIRP